MKNIRLRFAPSPTGYLHIGGLRSALMGYLAAKSMNGKFILRIEDTDEKRKVEDAAEKLVEIMEWAGIKFDEGPTQGGEYGPYVQSERRDIYDKYKEELLDKGEAYHCFCTPERLDEMRKDQQAKKLPPRYDRCCRDLSPEEVQQRIDAGEKYVIRQKMPLEGTVKIFDELRGEIVFQAKELEDHVLIKTTGMPTYQFANVVDDHVMEISHVFRGEEWIPSFPKNVLLYKSFGWEKPKFVHLPVVLNKEGGKLSKRQGDVAVEDFRDKGYLQEALVNFNALLGWHPEGDNEIFTMEEAIAGFDYKNISVSPAIFNTEKLDFLNGYYIREKDLDTLTEMCKPFLLKNADKAGENKKEHDFLKKIVAIEQERLKTISEIEERTKFFFADSLDYDPEMLIWKKSSKEEVKVNLEKVIELIEKVPVENWTVESLNDAIVTYLQAKEEKVGPYLWPMRVALTGEKASPSPFEVASVLGKEESIRKIREGIDKL